MAQQLHISEHVSDDMSIARGLLGGPNIPLRRRTSLTSTTTGNQVEVFDEGIASTETRNEGRRRPVQSSNTWTASSGEALSEVDDIEDRTFFVNEYNRLALKHGVRTLLPEESDVNNVGSSNGSNKSGSWFTRKILRKTSSSQSVKTRSDRLTKHRRSISDLSLRLKSKSDTLKDKDLQDLVRLCGLSLLYLPTEYAASSLAVPTCFRATAQYLVQHASTARGVFRIPGSHNVVTSLYNHYCTMDSHGEVVAGTVRCPTLPEHIRCDVHDVASAFKKFISGLPGGILGSLPLFDALISIQSQLNGVPELTRTKQSKVRARLIALAIATLRSQYRRELICAVFGLLSMIGRAAEITPRENDRGRPLPTSDLMGYGPLGIVFGPLLVGDMLENYTMRLANPRGGLVLLPLSPPKSRKERSKKSKASEDATYFNSHVDKIKIANSTTEMLITHWRDVVRHMRNLKALKVVRSYKSLEAAAPKQSFLRPSASESFALRKPPDWDNDNSPLRQIERCDSPTPAGRESPPSRPHLKNPSSHVHKGGGGLLENGLSGRASPESIDALTVRKQRARPRPMLSQKLSGVRSMSILSPTKEENPAECQPESERQSGQVFTSAPSTSRISAIPPKQFSVLAPVSNSAASEKPTQVAVPLTSYEANPWIESVGRVSTRTYNEPQNGPSEIVSGDDSEPLPHHDLKDYPPSPKEELRGSSAAAIPQFSLIETRLMGPRIPEPPRQPFPAIKISQVPSSSQPKSEQTAQRRKTASEPGLRPENPHRCPPRSSKSTYGDAAQKVAIWDWNAAKDPLARVSVAEDLASLAALAHVLEDEPFEAIPTLGSSRKIVSPTRDETPACYGQSDTESFSRVVRKEDNKGTFRQLTAEARKDAAHIHCELKKVSDRPPVPKFEGRPNASEGPNYSRLPGGILSPTKKTVQGPIGMAGSPTNSKQGGQLVSSQTSSVDIHIEKTEVSVDESPRVSVRDLAAKFNTGDSRSPSSPSPTKSPLKALSVDVRAASDCSPKQRVIAPYTTNPPSPTKSQKSGKSDVSLHLVRLAPPLERSFAKASPPRRLLKADLHDSTPLRPVRASVEESMASARGTLSLRPSELPACCSHPGSPQQLSLYDGYSVGNSRSNSSDPVLCPVTSHVPCGPQNPSDANENTVTTAYLQEPSSIPTAINFPTNQPPTRSNSLLHAQIRSLQQQLNNQIKEIRHLRQQVGRQGSLDIGALSEELREAKKELNMWRNRAEIAEKQLEVMVTLSARGSRHIMEKTLAGHPAPFSPKTGYSEDGAVTFGKLRKSLHGMDGANSHLNSSEESTATVVRDVRKEPIIGGEYCMR